MRPEKKPQYIASSLQCLPLTKVPLWDQTTLEAAKVSVPLPSLQSRDEPKTLRERIQRRGVSSLSTSELLTVSLSGKEEMVSKVNDLLTSYSLQQLLNADTGELNKHGLTEAKAVQLQATLEVARRLLLPSDENPYQIKSPVDAAEYVRAEMEYLDHEEVRVLLLDTKNCVTANLALYKGTISSSVLRAGEIFRAAVTRNSPGIIIAHNHPSGSPEPSPEDIAVTEQLIQAGRVLDIDFVDHIIIGKNRNFVSLKERLRW